MKYFRTTELGYILLVIDDNNKKRIVMIDPWKFGLLDSFYFEGTLDDIKKEINQPKLTFESIEKDNALWFIAYAYRISKKINFPIKSEILQWLDDIKIQDIKIDGSYYKCFNCEIGELSEEDDKTIIKMTRQAIKNGNIISNNEKQYYFVCKECKEKVEKNFKIIDN